MDSTIPNLLKRLDELDTLMQSQLGKMANKNNGIKERDFLKYIQTDDAQLLFTKIYEVKAELRARGVNVPHTFPEKNGSSVRS